ncbi:MAG TPA: regulatory protein RecX [Clostridiaceae bacterium]|nr:regulatory protein RecX [Clostridiaceae bacterium]
MRITSVERNKKRKDMLAVYVDGEYSFSISEEDFISLSLYEKKDITSEEITHIKEEVNFRRAKAEAVKFLALRLRSEMEVAKKLMEKGFDKNTVQKVTDELKSMGYINDRLYIQKYIYDRIKLKPKSKRLIKYELMSKGISEADIDEVMKDWKADETVLAESMVRKKFGKYDTRDQKIQKRIYSFLQHRGFGFEVIDTVMNRINNPDYY